jgi:hypothetical protein
MHTLARGLVAVVLLSTAAASLAALRTRSSRGISRLLQRDGGRTLAAGPVHCATERQEGENRLWDSCTVEAIDSTGALRDRRLFGGILAHRGTFKFLTYANEY